MSNFFSRTTKTCLLVLILLGCVQGEELWVRNRPYQGSIKGSGHSLMVDAQTLLETLQIQAEDNGDHFVVGGFPIAVEQSGSVRYVSLRDVVDAAGLRLSRNEALGTIDVRGRSAGKGSRGGWTSSGRDSGNSPRRKKGTPTKIAGPNFSASIPGHLNVVVDTPYLKSGESENAKAESLAGLTAGQDIKAIFVATSKAGESSGRFSASRIPDLPKGLDSAKQKRLLSALRDGILANGGRIVSKPSVANVAGKRFQKIVYLTGATGQKADKNEVYLYYSSKHGEAFMLLMTAPKKTFNRLAPQLRLILKNFRIK